MSLDGRVALVTGAGGGIGRGIALCLAEAGADVVVNSFHEETAAKVAGEIIESGRESLGIAADVTSQDGVDRVVRETLDKFSRIDILVNNFGAHTQAFYDGTSPRFAKQDISEWDEDYEFNLKSMAMMCMAVVPHLQAQKSGKIVNITSIAGIMPIPSQMTYGAAKAGAIYFTRTLAADLGRDGINVNCISPGGVFTGMSLGSMEKAIAANPDARGMTPHEYWQKFVVPNMPTPLRQELTTEDIGHATVFLASDKARSITGQNLNVDCGMVMY